MAADFGVRVQRIERVAGGADSSASVWRAATATGDAFAVKISEADLSAGLRASALLARHGVPAVLDPVRTVDGQLWSTHHDAQLSLTPWRAGCRGIERALSAAEWRAFGSALARVHAVELDVQRSVPVEGYASTAVDAVRRVDQTLAGRDADHWSAHADSFRRLAEATDDLGRVLHDRPVPRVLTHGDCHLGNLIIGAEAQLWILDWDAAAMAAPERDLMFVLGGGVLTDHPVTEEQQAWFFEGYGSPTVERDRLTYFTCARAVEDVTGWAMTMFNPARPSQERRDALAIFGGLTAPTGIVTIAQKLLRELG
nr:aminoglycoside phosphotransferase family protein [Microlunatus panaciterrae]